MDERRVEKRDAEAEAAAAASATAAREASECPVGGRAYHSGTRVEVDALQTRALFALDSAHERQRQLANEITRCLKWIN